MEDLYCRTCKYIPKENNECCKTKDNLMKEEVYIDDAAFILFNKRSENCIKNGLKESLGVCHNYVTECDYLQSKDLESCVDCLLEKSKPAYEQEKFYKALKSLEKYGDWGPRYD